MKNTSKAHRKGGKKVPSPQVQTLGDKITAMHARQSPKIPIKSRYGKQFDLGNAEQEPSCLCVFNLEEQRPVTRVPFTDAEYGALWQTATISQGSHVAQFTADAIRLTLELPAALQQLNKLDSAINQSHALHFLLYDCMNREDVGQYLEGIRDGIMSLIIQTQYRLKEPVAALESLLRRLPSQQKEVAS